MRRGFKAYAETLAKEMRGELRIDPLRGLEPRTLAAHLGIPILNLSELKYALPAEVSTLLTTEHRAFSACTVFHLHRRLIIFNDAHSIPRQNADIAHEIAHGLLHHEPTRLLDDYGCRVWDADMEDEANWLAGALLVTPQAAFAIARRNCDLTDAAGTLGVSRAMLQWRMNVTGARRRNERARAVAG